MNASLLWLAGVAIVGGLSALLLGTFDVGVPLLLIGAGLGGAGDHWHGDIA